MKIRTTCYYSLLSVGAVALACSSLVFGQEAAKPGSAVEKDPFKKSGGGGSAAGGGVSENPFTGGEQVGAGAAVENPFAAGGGAAKQVKPERREYREPVALLEYIQTDLVTANELLGKFGASQDARPLREKLEEMIDADEAELVETCFLRTTAGQRMKVESVREHIYPTEFDPAEIPLEFEGKSALPPISSANPTAFETRNVGMIVEIDPNIGEAQPSGTYIDMNIAPERVRYLGDRALAPGGGPELTVITQPEFATMKISTSETIREGGTSLLGVLTPTPAEGKRVFVFLSAGILKPGFAEVKKETEIEQAMPRRIVTHLEWIELDHREANRLLRTEWLKRDASDLRATLGGMMEAGDAKLVETSYAKTRPGQRTKVESGKEHLYPTEWDPGEIPNKLKLADTEIRGTGANPTAIDMRNVGTTVELEPNIGVDGVVSVNIAPEIVEYLGDRMPNENCLPEVSHIAQPDFYMMKLQTNVTAFPGQHNLIGSFTPPGDPDKRVLLLMKVDVVR